MKTTVICERPILFAIFVFAILNAAIPDTMYADKRAEDIVVEFNIAKEGDLVIVPVTIADKQYPFALSTASRRTVVDKCLRHLLAKPVARIDRLADSEELPSFSMKIGTESFSQAKPPLYGDFTEFREHYGHEVYGTIGLDFLGDRIIQVDFDYGKLRILSSFSLVDLPPEAVLKPLIIDAFGSGSYTTRLDISGEPQFFIVDTLFARSLAMHPIFVERLLKSGSLTHFMETSFYISPQSRFCMREGQLDRVSCDDLTQRNVSLVEQERNRVGLAYLSRFQLTFDFKKEYLYLIPGARIDDPDHCMRNGMELAMKNKKATVLYVFPDQVAAKAGVRVGDVILQIDGKDAGDFSMFEIRKTFAERNGVRVKFLRPERAGHPTSEYAVVIANEKPESSPRPPSTRVKVDKSIP